MVAGLSGCMKSFDATSYVQAELDLLTRHDVKQYEKVLGISEAKTEEVYKTIIEKMDISQSLLQGAEASEEVKESLEQWFIDALSKTKYTVSEAKKVDGDYIVVVEVEPVKILEGMAAGLTKEAADYMQQMESAAAAGGEAPSQGQINNDTMNMLIHVLNSILENVTYGEKVSVETKIVKGDSGKYEVDEASFGELGEKLLDPTDTTQVFAE